MQAAAALAALPNVKFLSALRRANVRGALELGLTPGFLPGRVTFDAARGHFADAWGSVPALPGLDAAGILDAAAGGSIGALVLLGAEPEQDFPDRIRMRAGLDAVPFVVAVGAFTSDAAARADVFLPTSVWGEKAGSTTNLEGRVQRMARLITPEGQTMDDWRIAQELATRFDAVFGFETVDDVQDEIGDECLLQRRGEPFDELVRQAAHEADGVGHEVTATLVLEAARRRVERLEQAVAHGDVGVGERVQQRRLANVRVAGERDRRHLRAPSLLAADLALAAELL